MNDSTEGVWIVRFGKVIAAVFPSEVEALRYVVDRGGVAEFIAWGEVNL